MAKSNKKRKREKSSRSLSTSEGQPQDRNESEVAELRERIGENDKKREKHRKKKTRKISKSCDIEQTFEKVDGEERKIGQMDAIEDAATQTSTGQQRQNENILDDSAKQRKKKKKKRKARESRSSSSDSMDYPDKKDASSGRTDDFHDRNIRDDDEEDEPVLEGAMVSNVLVLIDRKIGKVYSATEERQDNGERKQVGYLDGKGGVVLFQISEKIENAVEPLPNSNNVNDKNNDPSSDFPYEVDPDDHCESPLEAYKDIVPLLESYRRWIRKQSNDELSIYDPYFCNGRVARHLDSLGFPEVYNRKEDCYKVWSDPSLYPKYDIFLTNPPYSTDHIEKLMDHVTSEQNKKKPWMLLMPNFVHKKDYFQKLTSDSGQLPIYLVPKKRYIYQPPPNMRAKKASSTHKKSSPFVSMWYLWGGSREVTDEWYRVLRKQHSAAFDVARSKSALRDLRRKPKK